MENAVQNVASRHVLGRSACAALLSLSLGLGAACGGDDASSGGPDAGGDAPDAGDGFTTLIEGEWALPAGTEGYACVVKTITEDTYITSFQPVIPLGTHHTVLSRFDQDLADGIYFGENLGNDVWCNGFTAGTNMIFGSGVGTEGFTFPAGVAVKLSAGEKIVLNLHLFNVSDGELRGTSGTRFKSSPVSEVEHEAEIVLMGPTLSIAIPGHAVDHEIAGSCTLGAITEPLHVFSITPHMHQTASHLKTHLERVGGGDPEVIFDKPYSFDEQVGERMSPEVILNTGDKIVTTCTYTNPGETVIEFGESSTNEMCFSSLYYWPAQGHLPYCSDDFGGW